MFEATAAGIVIGFLGGYLIRDTFSVSDGRDSIDRFLDERRDELQTQYAESKMTHRAFVNRIVVIEDPETEQIIRDAVTVDGIGPETALEIARTFNADYDAYRAAGRDELEKVNGVGENRATALLNN